MDGWSVGRSLGAVVVDGLEEGCSEGCVDFEGTSLPCNVGFDDNVG